VACPQVQRCCLHNIWVGPMIVVYFIGPTTLIFASFVVINIPKYDMNHLKLLSCVFRITSFLFRTSYIVK